MKRYLKIIWYEEVYIYSFDEEAEEDKKWVFMFCSAHDELSMNLPAYSAPWGCKTIEEVEQNVKVGGAVEETITEITEEEANTEMSNNE